MNFNTSSTLLVVFLILLVTTSVGLAKPQGDTSIISESNIDLTAPLTVEEDEVIQTPFMQAKLNSETTEIHFSGYVITTTLLNAKRVNSEPAKKGVVDTILFKTPEKKKLNWINVMDGVDITQTLYENRLKEEITVKNKNAPAQFTFGISYSDELTATVKDKVICFTDANDRVLIEIEEPFAMDRNNKRYAYKYTLTDGILKLIPVDDISSAKYPLVIDPSYTITTGGDAESTKSVAQRKLTRDINGSLWAVYDKGSSVYIAKSTTDGDSWDITNIATNGAKPSITSDSKGYLHVAYSRSGTGVRYIKYDGSSWSSPLTISSSSSANYGAIAVDSEDNLHVVWQYTTSRDLKYRKYNASSSSWETVTTLSSSMDNIAGAASIAIAPNDVIHVAWVNASEKIDYIKYSGGAWGSIVNISTSSNCDSPSIAVDTGGTVHIVWEISHTTIKYIRHTGAGWGSITELVSGGDKRTPSVAVSSSSNIVYVVWTNSSTYIDTKYYTTSWSDRETIITGTNNYYPGLIMDLYPADKCNNERYSVPYTGFAMLYVDGDIIKYYNTPSFEWETISAFTLVVHAKDIKTGDALQNFTASLDTGDEKTTDNGTVTFPCLDTGSYTVSVATGGYYVSEKSVYMDMDKEITTYLTEIGGAGVQYAPHFVEFRVVDIWGEPLINIDVNVTYERSGGNGTMDAITDSAGGVGFEMMPSTEYTLKFINATQDINTTIKKYPHNTNYVITIGAVPEQMISYWITTQQNNTGNTGNITMHYYDYNSPVKTNWVNFSVYYMDNGTMVHTHNFTSPTDINENTTNNLNASHIYKVKITADHEEFGEVFSYSTIVFVVPSKPFLPAVETMREHLADWQITLVGMFIIILFAMLFEPVSNGIAGLVVGVMAYGFYFFGLLPLIPSIVANTVFPVIVLLSVVNLLADRREEPG